MTTNRLIASLLCLLLGCATAQQPATGRSKTAIPDPRQEAERLNTIGAGYMGMQDFERALSFFRRAYKLDPALYAARLNEGIALLNQQKYPASKPILLEATERRPSDPRAWYNLGLLEKATGNSAAALAAFERAAAADPKDADSKYLAGQMMLDSKRYDEAITRLEAALALDRFHASAEYALARAYQRSARQEQSREHALRFQKLTRENVAAPLGIGYGQQGHYSLVEAKLPHALTAAAAIPVRFVDVTAAAGLRFKGAAAAQLPPVCIFDADGDGSLEIFIGNAGGRARLFRIVNGRFTSGGAVGVDHDRPAASCSTGDFDNDAATDLVIVDTEGFRLLRNARPRFQDATTKAGVNAENPRFATFLDIDHDGDLDLHLTSEQGGTLWQNRGDGTFSKQPFPSVPSQTAIATDLNDDSAVDLLVGGGFVLNQREGNFSPPKSFPGASPESFPLQSGDLSRDSRQDVLLQPAATSTLLIQGSSGFEPAETPPLGAHSIAIDFDNDGWPDLISIGAERLQLLRNIGNGKFADVTRTTSLDRISAPADSSLAAFDYDNDGDADLVLARPDGTVTLLRNEGGNRNSWVKLALRGVADNRSALGTKVEIFAAGGYQKQEQNGPSTYAGQNHIPLLFGLGSAASIERIRMRWPTGVVQDEAERAVRRTHRIMEIDRRSSSCPLLFTWNGSRFEFISDVIGAGVIGHWVSPGQRNVPDPTEYVKINGDQLRSENGRLKLRFLEPMEEVNYFDQARLLVIDHPADVQVFPNERFVSAPPFPEEKVIAVRNASLPLSARDGNGRSVLTQLTRRDRKYVTGFALEKFSGFAELHFLELEIPPVTPGAPVRLLLHGYTEYFTANSMYAAHQAGLDPIAPYVEAQTPDGNWRKVVDDMGFPAGLPRTMVADLTGKLAPGTTRIRIVTNLQIYWDQILIASDPQEATYKISEVPLHSATLRTFGFPQQKPASSTPGDLTYDYHRVSATGPFAIPRGAYTRLGDVTDLITRSDDRFAIFAPGDEIALEFDATSAPALATGWQRDYFFFADGFVKDMDFYGAQAHTVEPLPFHGMSSYPYPASERYPDDPEHLGYQLDYNDRFLFDEVSQSYRFGYNPDPQ